MRAYRRSLPLALIGLVLLLSPAPSHQQGRTLFVNNVDPSCGGRSPCYTTIQAAVDAAVAGDTIQIQAGTYREQVLVSGKNNVAGATEASRILIEADPAATLGSVVLQGTVPGCTNGHAVRFQQSKFITLRGSPSPGPGARPSPSWAGSTRTRPFTSSASGSSATAPASVTAGSRSPGATPAP